MIGFYVGNRQETFDAEILAIMGAIHLITSRQQAGQGFAIFTDFQAATQSIKADSPRPGYRDHRP